LNYTREGGDFTQVTSNTQINSSLIVGRVSVWP